ncbi:Haloacid dehalogenase-like hydrolase domain-containing protein 3 [Coemansia sp. BCRC 34962]|nr:Haloacid dehalogenase-like hydrolase domain-containing protein 3 [Coemansia sp. BCRC 34962]
MNRGAKPLANIRLVTFDLFETLYTPAEPISTTYTRPLHRHGFKSIREEAVGANFARAFKEIHDKYPCYGRSQGMTSTQWWEQVVGLTWKYAGNINIKEHPGLLAERDQLIARFASSQGYRMFGDVPRVLSYLQRKGVRLGVVSNMDERAECVLGLLGIRRYFDFVLTSISVGVEKPDKRLFEMAMGAVDVRPYDALHVGDSERLDYLPARSAGMEARLVDRSRSVVRDPKKYIGSLDDLIKLI